MRRTEHELRLARPSAPVARVIGPVHDFPGGGPTRTRLPEFHRVQVRHPQLDRARRVHLFAAHLRDLLQRAQAEGKVGVKSAAQFSHEPRAEQQLVRGDFGVGRAFLEGGNEKSGPEFHETPVREQPPERDAN